MYTLMQPESYIWWTSLASGTSQMKLLGQEISPLRDILKSLKRPTTILLLCRFPEILWHATSRTSAHAATRSSWHPSRYVMGNLCTIMNQFLYDWSKTNLATITLSLLSIYNWSNCINRVNHSDICQWHCVDANSFNGLQNIKILYKVVL